MLHHHFQVVNKTNDCHFLLVTRTIIFSVSLILNEAIFNCSACFESHILHCFQGFNLQTHKFLQAFVFLMPDSEKYSTVVPKLVVKKHALQLCQGLDSHFVHENISQACWSIQLSMAMMWMTPWQKCLSGRFPFQSQNHLHSTHVNWMLLCYVPLFHRHILLVTGMADC